MHHEACSTPEQEAGLRDKEKNVVNRIIKKRITFFFNVSFTFSSSLRLAVKLLASDRRRAHNMGGGTCLEGGAASAGDGVE